MPISGSWRFFPRRLSKAESDIWVENAQFHIETQRWGFWAVEIKQQHQLIGIVSFTALKNLRAQAVMQAANTTFMYPQLPTDSALREHCLYELSQLENIFNIIKSTFKISNYRTFLRKF